MFLNARVNKSFKLRVALVLFGVLALLFSSGCGVAPDYVPDDGASSLGTPDDTPLDYPPSTASTPESYVPPNLPVGPGGVPLVPQVTPMPLPEPATAAGQLPLAASPVQLQIVGLPSGVQSVPPVLVAQFIDETESSSGSTKTVQPSVFAVEAMAVSSVAGVEVQSLTLDPAYAGTVQPVASNVYEIEITMPGPVTVVATGTSAAGSFQAEGLVYIPRQINAEWTNESNNNDGSESSKERNVLICNNMTAQPITFSISGPGGAPAEMSLEPEQQNVFSPEFEPVTDAQFGGQTGIISLAIGGNVPVGALVCEGVALSCSGCDDPSDHSFKQSFTINDGQL